jgi:hypothetical protein
MASNSKIDPREMAAAPLTPSTKPADDWRARLKFLPAGATAKVNIDTDGSKSKKVANVLVPVTLADGTQTHVKGSIYAKLAPGSKSPVATFSWFGNPMIRQNCMSPADDQEKGVLLKIAHTIAEAYSTWIKANPHARTAAVHIGEDVTLDGIEF